MTFRRRVENIREAGFNFQETRHRVGFSLSLSPFSVFLSATLPQQTAAAVPSGRFIRFGTCHDEAVVVAAPATGRLRRSHRYRRCLNGGSPPVLGTCFTADTRLLLLLPARYTALPFFARGGASPPPPTSSEMPLEASWLLKISPVCRGI